MVNHLLGEFLQGFGEGNLLILRRAFLLPPLVLEMGHNFVHALGGAPCP
jgi:hypothetical protein